MDSPPVKLPEQFGVSRRIYDLEPIAFTPSPSVAGESGAVDFPSGIKLAARRADLIAEPQAPKGGIQKEAPVEPTLSAAPSSDASSPKPRDFATLSISPRVPRLTSGRSINAGSVELRVPPIDCQVLRVNPRTMQPLPPAPVHGSNPLETKGFNPLPAGSPRINPEREFTADACELPQSPLSSGADLLQPKSQIAQPVDLTEPVRMASTVPVAPASPEQHPVQPPRPVRQHLRDMVTPREPEPAVAAMPVDSARFAPAASPVDSLGEHAEPLAASLHLGQLERLSSPEPQAVTSPAVLSGESAGVDFAAGTTLPIASQDALRSKQAMEQRAPSAGFQEEAVVEPLLPTVPAPTHGSLEPQRFDTLDMSAQSPRLTSGRDIHAGSVALREPPIDRQVLGVEPRTMDGGAGPRPAEPEGRSGTCPTPHDFVRLQSPKLTSGRQATAISLEIPRAPLGRNALDVPPRTMAAAPKNEVEACGFSWILVSNLAPVLTSGPERNLEGCRLEPFAGLHRLECPDLRQQAGNPVRSDSAGPSNFTDLSLGCLAPVLLVRETKRTQLCDLPVMGLHAGEMSAPLSGAPAQPQSPSAELEFDIAISAVVPILNLEKPAEPQPARMPEPPLYPLEPVAMRQAPLKPWTQVDPLSQLQVPEPGSRTWALEGAAPSRILMRAGFAPEMPPDVREMAGIPLVDLAGADPGRLAPELVFPEAPIEKPQRSLQSADKVKEWLRPIDDDAWPVTGAVWIETEFKLSMPATSVADLKMRQTQRLWPIRPACILREALTFEPIGSFDMRWQERPPLLLRGDALPIATPLQNDALAGFDVAPPKLPEMPVEILPGFFQTLPERLKRFSVGVPLMMLILFAMWSVGGKRGSGPLASVRDIFQSRAKVEFTDDFHSGAAKWIGAASSWAFDQGSVRPGNLAVFEPTMKLSDYRLEFLGQIDQKAISWAFRAADTRNYYAMKMEIVKPGPLPEMALLRYTVIDGRPGAAVSYPVRVTFHNGTPYRFRSEVTGRKFATYVEDELIDFFTDEKLAKGGVGFFSDKDERANLYWVKVTNHDDFLGRVCSYLALNKAPAPPDLQATLLHMWMLGSEPIR